MGQQISAANYVKFVGRAIAEQYLRKDLNDDGKIDARDRGLAIEAGRKDAARDFARLDATGDDVLSGADARLVPSRSGDVYGAIADYCHAVAQYGAELGAPQGGGLEAPRDRRPIRERPIGGDPHAPKKL